jgi:hypothetical protein
MPRVIFGQSLAFDRTPKIDDFFFRHGFEKILIGIARPWSDGAIFHNLFFAPVNLIGSDDTGLTPKQS